MKWHKEEEEAMRDAIEYLEKRLVDMEEMRAWLLDYGPVDAESLAESWDLIATQNRAIMHLKNLLALLKKREKEE